MLQVAQQRGIHLLFLVSHEHEFLLMGCLLYTVHILPRPSYESRI